MLRSPIKDLITQYTEAIHRGDDETIDRVGQALDNYMTQYLQASVTPLIQAVMQNDVAGFTNELAVEDVNVNARNLNDEDRTPAHYAARNGNVAMLASLIGAGADPANCDTWGRNALHHAVSYLQQKAVEYLLNLDDKRLVRQMLYEYEEHYHSPLLLARELRVNPDVFATATAARRLGIIKVLQEAEIQQPARPEELRANGYEVSDELLGNGDDADASGPQF